MSIETVVSIIESATGGGVVSRLMSMSSAEFLAFHRQQAAHLFFKEIPKRTAAWIARIQYLRRMSPGYLTTLVESQANNFAFQSAMAKMAAEEAAVSHAARIATANLAASAAEGTLVAGAGTTVAAVVVPVVAMIAVGVALGAPYYQARQEARREESASGFAKGFVTGLLNWELRFTIDRFWDNAVGKNGFDEAMPTIRATAHNKALLAGRVAGLAKDTEEKGMYLRGLRKLTRASSANWSARSNDWSERMRARQVQISYAIELAAAARKHGIIMAG